MVGITRFNIIDGFTGKGGQRIRDAKTYWPIANKLYREIFEELGMPLLPEDEIIDCTKAEFEAGYDYQLGIDIILRANGLGESTLQEKILFTDFYTVTVEHCQDWMTLEPGDWFKLKAQYHFVGYDRNQLSRTIYPWVLIDWTTLQRATAQGRIKWHLRDNDRRKVGARASFMYTKFDELPLDIKVAASNRAFSFF